MDGKRPHINSAPGLNFFPLLGNAFGNSQKLLNQLNAFRIPQRTANMDSDSMQRMRVSDDFYNSSRDSLPFNDRKEGSLKEPPYNRFQYTPPGEDRFGSDSWHRGHRIIDQDIPQHFVYPEMDWQQRDEFNRRKYGAAMARDSRVYESNCGSRGAAAVPWNAVIYSNCYLVPPVDDTYELALSEKQQGCHSVLIVGLPSMADEEIIRDIFSGCGPIEKITLTYLHTNTQVKHCILQFVEHDSVDRAVKLNGHVLVIGDGGDGKAKVGRLHVDYYKEFKDEDKKVKMQSLKEAIQLSTFYSCKESSHLLGMIRNDQAIEKCLDLLAHWIEKGDCNRKTVNDFHTMLSAVNNLTKRLINRRKEHEQQVEKQRQQSAETANEIKKQCEDICKVFEAATKKRSWDQFTKAQRKNITLWHNAIKSEINSAKEAEIQNRVEVGMDLDDEVSSLGGLIEQPSLQITEGQLKESGEACLSPSKAKKRRMENSESATDSLEALKSEKKKLETQVESLKAIAEQNSYLMWSMQSYQQQAETMQQQYNELVAQKDYEIFQLRNVLQGANIITDPQRAMSELDIVVDMGRDDTNVIGKDSETEKAAAGSDRKDGNQDSDQVEGNSMSVQEEHSGDNPEQLMRSDNEYSSKKCQEEQDMSLDKTYDTNGGALHGETRVEDAIANTEKEKEPDYKKGEKEEENQELYTENQAQKQESLEENFILPIKNEEKQLKMEEKEARDDIEEEEGSGRFVEIDNEEFEVIDDMDEEADSGDDDNREVKAGVETETVQGIEHVTPEQPDPSAKLKIPEDTVEAFQGTITSQCDTIKNDEMSQELLMSATDYQSKLLSMSATSHTPTGSWSYSSHQMHITGEELILVSIMCSYLQLCPSGATSGEIRDYLSRQFKERRKDVVERLLCSLPVLFKAEDVSGNAKWKFSGFRNLAEFRGQS